MLFAPLSATRARGIVAGRAKGRIAFGGQEGQVIFVWKGGLGGSRDRHLRFFASCFTELLDLDRDAPALGAGKGSGALLVLLREALFQFIQPFENFWSALQLA